MARPVVAFELAETRVTAGRAAVYAVPNDPASFADRIDELLNDPTRRTRMGLVGRARVLRGLSWDHSRQALLDAYAQLLDGSERDPAGCANGRTWGRFDGGQAADGPAKSADGVSAA
jgi:hypothetical protein